MGGLSSMQNMGGFNANTSLMNLQATLNMQMALATAAAKQMHSGQNLKNQNDGIKKPLVLNNL